MLQNCSCNKITSHWGVKTPHSKALSSQGGKISGNCLFKAVWSAGRVWGEERVEGGRLKKSDKEKEAENEKRGGKGEEKPGDRRKDR